MLDFDPYSCTRYGSCEYTLQEKTLYTLYLVAYTVRQSGCLILAGACQENQTLKEIRRKSGGNDGAAENSVLEANAFNESSLGSPSQ